MSLLQVSTYAPDIYTTTFEKTEMRTGFVNNYDVAALTTDEISIVGVLNLIRIHSTTA